MPLPAQARRRLEYQRDAGFTGRDLDDIPGPRTRATMHSDLKAAESLAFGPAAPPPDLLREIGGIRDLWPRPAVASTRWRNRPGPDSSALGYP